MSNQGLMPSGISNPDSSADDSASPSRLLLVRHGESTWNAGRRFQGQSDAPLSERGGAQARALAARLAGARLAAIYSSDLLRAWETAVEIGVATGITPVAEPGLREVGLGDWEGLTRDDLQRDAPELLAAWDREPDWDIVPGGEGAGPFLARVRETLAGLQGQHLHGDVLCVTHGGVIQAALLDIVGRPTRGMFPFLIENCSLSIVQRRRGRNVVATVNDTCHLSVDGAAPPPAPPGSPTL